MSSVTVLRAAPVSAFFTSTAAPATTEPEGSITVPEMLARSCAKVPGENAARMSAHARTQSNELEYMPRVRRGLVVRKVEALRTIKGIAIPLATTTIRHFNTTKHTNAMRIWTYYLREQRFCESRAGPNDSIPRPRKIRAQLQIRPRDFNVTKQQRQQTAQLKSESIAQNNGQDGFSARNDLIAGSQERA